MQWRHVSTAHRAFSTSSRPVRATKFVDAFLRETKEPIWRVVTALNTPRSLDLPAALARHGVTVEQLRQWRPIAYESNVSSAVDLMQRKGLAVARMPSWLVVYLVAFKVRTLENATPTALDLAYTHLPSAPSSVQGPLLILTLLSLARFNLLLPMRRVVDSFLTTNLHHPALCFNLLLQALACTPTRSVDTANAVVAVLKRMDARQLKLTHATYDALLNDRFVTLQLTKYLRERMTREGTVPTAEHLEAYLRVFAKHGLIHKAEDYHQAIHARHRTPVSAESQNAGHDPLHRANTLFLAAQDDRASAFNFLRALLEPSQSSVPAKVKSAKTTYTPAPHNVDAYTYTAALSLAARDHTLPSPALLALFNRLSPSPSTSLTSPIAPTTATHTVLIRGLLARKDFALALGAWERFCKSGLRIDREALSAGVQVLTRAGLPHRAWALLEEVAGPASPSPSLSPSPSPSRSSSKKETQTVPALRRPLEITTVTINDFLVALNRIGRPDVVFAVWDGMRAMYGVQPDARTLSLVLQAARVAWRMDGESWRGAVVRLGFEFRAGRTRGGNAGGDVDVREGPDPEGTRRVDFALDTRAAHVHRLTALLGAPHLPVPHAYKPGLWHGTLPATHALRLFQQALFGSARDPRRLVSVQEPASALERSVWGAPEGEGRWGLGVGLPSWHGRRRKMGREGAGSGSGSGSGWRNPGWGVLLRPRRDADATRKEEREDTDTDTLTTEDFWKRYDPHHPGIAPTNENCFHYILLLCLMGRTREVALVLAWMREVGIRPGRNTLGAAMVLWGEVCPPRGPLVERWTRGGGGEGREGEGGEGEYGKLVRWLQEWVGVWRMPGPRALAVWTRNLARLREGGRELREVEEPIEEAEKEEGRGGKVDDEDR